MCKKKGIWPWLRIGVKKLTVLSYVRLGIQVRNKYNSKRTFKNEQLAAHSLLNKPDKYFQKNLHGLTNKKIKGRT